MMEDSPWEGHLREKRPFDVQPSAGLIGQPVASGSEFSDDLGTALLGFSPAATLGKKKLRGDGSPVSKVLHIRSLPPGVSEHEVVAVFSSFGHVEQILLLHSVDQALVQCSSVEMAIRVVTTIPEAIVRGHRVWVQYSQHTSISRPVPHQARGRAASPRAGKVLRATVSNQLYPLDLDTFHQVFRKHGEVVRIATFVKAGLTNALVEYRDVMTAAAAREALDGQCIYAHACQLAVEFSRLDKLDISSNDPTHHDYTVAPQHAFSGAASMISAVPVAGFNGGPGGPSQHSQPHPGMEGGMPQTGASTTGSLQHMFGPAPGESADPFGLDSFRSVPVDPFDSPFSVQQPRIQGPHSFGSAIVPPALVSVTPGRVILANNLSNDVSPDVLATLVGVYADVIRVKILFKKPDSALIQLRDAAHTDRVLRFLNGVELRGKPLKLMRSKHTEVSLPRPSAEMSPEDQLNKDYSNSDCHRYTPGANTRRNNLHQYPPCQVLHLSNLPPEKPTDEIAEFFLPYGQVVSIKRFDKDPKMMLIEMGSLASAIEALIGLHNTYVTADRRVRISFSRRPGAAA